MQKLINDQNLRRRAGGFTLIELLVVVAIISVLISILLPSLSSARRLARRVVCGAHLHQIGIAQASYGNEGDGWIIGAPNGSGIPALGPGGVNDYRDEPTTAWDWASPMRRRYMGETSVDLNDQLKRLAETREGVFQCPEQSLLERYENSTGAPPGFPPNHPDSIHFAPSYLTMWKLLLCGSSWAEGSVGRIQGNFTTATGRRFDARYQIAPSDWETAPPRNYRPRLVEVGPLDRKIFLMDGTRFISNSGVVTYWMRFNATEGLGTGNFSSSGPVFRGSREYGTEPPYAQKDLGRKSSYRHGSNNRLGANALFFDGHVSYLDERDTRYHGLTTPSGSTLRTLGQMEPESQALLNGYNPGDVLPD